MGNILKHNKYIIILEGEMYVISGAWYFNDIVWARHSPRQHIIFHV
jgi:hypothetical protein